MGPLLVVEREEAIERALQRAAGREVVTPKRDAPVLMQDRFLEPLDEAIRPGVTRLCLGHRNTESLAAGGERAFKLFPVVREDALEPPAGPAIRRPHDLAQEGQHGGGGDLT